MNSRKFPQIDSCVLQSGTGSDLPLAIATLALGIGATLAVFNVVNGVLLRPLPYKNPDRISMIWIAQRGDDGNVSELPLTSGFFADVEREARSFASMAAFRAWPYALAHAPTADPEPVAGARVSPALFDVLGVHAAAGRTFTRAEAVPGDRTSRSSATTSGSASSAATAASWESRCTSAARLSPSPA
ncbi:MAG: ABC transporter permease [Gemmatimonadaceae bacterium]